MEFKSSSYLHSYTAHLPSINRIFNLTGPNEADPPLGAQFEKGCAAVLEKPNPEIKGKAPVLDEKAHRGGGGGGGFRGPRREALMDDDDVPEKDLLLAKVRKLEEEEISFRGESEVREDGIADSETRR
ncbi:hypothetical protein SASPL_145291 [Salvia splendens]|uniref:Uncharacterized protein n=1 Tax=Salvia splendens TaxID=180675 RepID=A0A8X8WHC5_SALSN|nr:hypothetical protein SASPL_145291 [Salvia splendens]